MGCAGRTAGESEGAEDGSGSGADTAGSGSASESQSEGSGSEATTANDSGSGSSDTDSPTGGSPTTGGSTACADPTTTYEVSIEVIDTGLGISGAPATIRNCTDTTAYVRNDCCYGPTYFLERRDSPDDPWMMATAGVACDCMGFVDPLEIEPGEEIEVPTNPPAYDSVPLCDVGIAYYRWTFFVGPDPDDEAAFEALTTDEFSWYCEG